MFHFEVCLSVFKREDTLYLGALMNMSNININDLMSDNQNLQELDEQKSQEISGGGSTSKETKTIGIRVDQFPPGDGGCPACISGYDPRYDQTV
jgi:hypothetical protein